METYWFIDQLHIICDSSSDGSIFGFFAGGGLKSERSDTLGILFLRVCPAVASESGALAFPFPMLFLGLFLSFCDIFGIRKRRFRLCFSSGILFAALPCLSQIQIWLTMTDMAPNTEEYPEISESFTVALGYHCEAMGATVFRLYWVGCISHSWWDAGETASH